MKERVAPRPMQIPAWIMTLVPQAFVERLASSRKLEGTLQFKSKSQGDCPKSRSFEEDGAYCLSQGVVLNP